MLTRPAPHPHAGEILAADLAAVGHPTEVYVEADRLVFPDLDDTAGAVLDQVLADHPAKVQAAAEAEAAATANETTIRDLARTALDRNREFLALPSPTSAQTLAQVKALTRQMNGLIRLELRDLSGTD